MPRHREGSSEYEYEAAKIVIFFSGPATKRGEGYKGRALRKKLEKKSETKLEGSARPNFFFSFPYLDGNAEIGVYVWSDLGYLISLRQ